MKRYLHELPSFLLIALVHAVTMDQMTCHLPEKAGSMTYPRSFVSVLHNSEFDVSTHKGAFETSTHCWVQALTEALTSGHLGGAGLDVHWVVCFPGQHSTSALQSRLSV